VRGKNVRMGGSASKPEAKAAPPSSPQPTTEVPKKNDSLLMKLCPYAGKETDEATKAMCPIAGKKATKEEPSKAATAEATGGGCPVRRKSPAAQGDTCPVKYIRRHVHTVRALTPLSEVPGAECVHSRVGALGTAWPDWCLSRN